MSDRTIAAGAAETVAPAPLRGYAAVAFAVLVWSGWIVATRDQVSTVAPLDIALLRYGVPAVLLAPVWLRRGLFPKGESALGLVVMAAGWGGAFVLLTAKGLETVPASLFGPMVPATLPLIVALWDRVALGGRIGGGRAAGLAFIAVSIALIVGPAAFGGDRAFFIGAPYLVLAACGWSAFTIAYRRSRLSGLEATAYVSLYSLPVLIGAAAILGSGLGGLDLATLGWLALVQGVLSGIGAVATFGYAVRHLGVARTSAFTSLVPMGAALGGWLILGERVGPLGWLSVVCACIGVALVNGAAAGLLSRAAR